MRRGATLIAALRSGSPLTADERQALAAALQAAADFAREQAFVYAMAPAALRTAFDRIR